VHYEIVTLENETDCMVPVGVPVLVFVSAGGNAVDYQFSAVIAVKTAYDVEKSSLSGAARPQHGNEFIVPEIQRHSVKSFLYESAGPVFFSDIIYLKHSLCIQALPFRSDQSTDVNRVIVRNTFNFLMTSLEIIK